MYLENIVRITYNLYSNNRQRSDQKVVLKIFNDWE